MVHGSGEYELVGTGCHEVIWGLMMPQLHYTPQGLQSAP